MNIKLVKLSHQYKEQLFDMLTEWKKDIEENKSNCSPRMVFRNDFHDFDYYLENLENLEIKEETPEGRVPDTTLFCLDVDRNIFVGAVNIRHYLTADILRTGGHIGRWNPSKRKEKGIRNGTVCVGFTGM